MFIDCSKQCLYDIFGPKEHSNVRKDTSVTKREKELNRTYKYLLNIFSIALLKILTCFFIVILKDNLITIRANHLIVFGVLSQCSAMEQPKRIVTYLSQFSLDILIQKI